MKERGRRSSLAIAASIAFVMCAGAPSARADSPGDTYRLAWTRGQGADACPSESELARLVKARLQRAPFEESAPRAIEGNAFRIDGRWHAELVVRDESGTLGRRELSAESDDCRALTAAVTLAIALTIDPEASSEPAGSATAAFPVPVAPAPPQARSPESTTSRAVTRIPVPFACPSCPVPERGPSVSALAVGSFALLPAPSLGAELVGRAPLGSLDALVSLRALPPVQTDDGHLSIGIVSGSLGLCGGKALGSARIDWCGQAEAGAITAMARDLLPVDPGSYPWLALATGPRVSWPARARFGLEAGIAGIVPLFRHRFQVASRDGAEFQTGPVGGILFLGVQAGGR